jgi:hypothetical protein
MEKEYSNKQMKSEGVKKKKEFFYPQLGITVIAESQEEADKIINNANNLTS